MNLNGMKISDFYGLTEKIAFLIDEHLKIKITDLSNINELVEKEVALSAKKSAEVKKVL